MKDLKAILKGPAGRMALGAFLGATIARLVDGESIWAGVGLGLVLGVVAIVVHGLISAK
jgi:ABC-type uncharacterized transport system permease subunit